MDRTVKWGIKQGDQSESSEVIAFRRKVQELQEECDSLHAALEGEFKVKLKDQTAQIAQHEETIQAHQAEVEGMQEELELAQVEHQKLTLETQAMKEELAGANALLATRKGRP